ncbi:MAG TPA: M1 family metallopeptidase, partial [Gemmatimonadaceae bacterium]|nr:M1 family metallopeptidase [Gemmatimonadaceae bacterium]
MLLLGALLVAVQQDTFVTKPDGRPPSTAGQRANYTITATLDEERQRIVAEGRLVYVNNSPDTLREMYVHQYLNAFRPGSRWSAEDAREGRVRFQNLREPDYGYERFTRAPVVDGRDSVRVEYPNAPDSTVARFALPRPLSPRETLTVSFAWEARVAAVPRRNGRRGRHWDLAQWFPKVAVYDNGGWEPNVFLPRGELYGEFGTFDVTLIVRQDQVIGATGVVVEGDPGWDRAKRFGQPWQPNFARYRPPPREPAVVPNGFKAVRFYAEDVHHFGWSVDPDYRYEGGFHVSRRRPGALPALPDREVFWDTLAVNVLYRPGDEAAWGNGIVLGRTKIALEWLETIYGPFAWPQLTNLHRLESGGTEFPMLVMNGSPSQGLILHEAGHQYSYGILANNEWRSGWMDEGLSDYQTAWAQGLVAQDRPARGGRDSVTRRTGYRGFVPRASYADASQMAQHRYVLLGVAQPLATPAWGFSEFGVYNNMIYGRGELMFGALRDAVGDSSFARFLHEYYGDWRLGHVDERALGATAERAAGRPLGWFFGQWLHETGLVDYALRDVDVARAADGSWETRARIRRIGEYRHPMPVGALTSGGWVVVRGEWEPREQTVIIRTAERPRAVRLDPWRTTDDWNRRNDVRQRLFPWLAPREERVVRTVVDWPFLDQSSRDRIIDAELPLVWTSRGGGTVIALRSRSNYQGWIDRVESGVGYATSNRRDRGIPGTVEGVPWRYDRFQGWLRVENPTLGRRGRPLVGFQFGEWVLDGVIGGEVAKTWDTSPFFFARNLTGARTLRFFATAPTDVGYLPARWEWADVFELSGRQVMRNAAAGTRMSLAIHAGFRSRVDSSSRAYGRIDARVERSRFRADSLFGLRLGAFASTSTRRTPLQR